MRRSLPFERAGDEREVSDADFDVYLAARDRYEPPTEVPTHRRLTYRSPDGVPEELFQQLVDRVIEEAEPRLDQTFARACTNE